MIILLENKSEIKYFAKESNEEIIIFLENTERPTTIIYPEVKGLANNLINEDKTVAIRIPNNEFCKTLLRKFGKPIVSTSANISGQIAPSIFKEINEQIKNAVDYVCKYRQEDEKKAAPSKIIKWNGDESVTTIRE